jgi:hypothetical protein
MFVQKSKDDQNGVRTTVQRILYQSLVVRGRRVVVSRLCPMKDQSMSLTIVPPIVTTRRSPRIAGKADIASDVGIPPICFILRDLQDFSQEINEMTTDIISKCSWVGKPYVSVESSMLKECGGMFGVPTHYHSSIVCHKDGLPATNHLFLNGAKFWPIFKTHSKDAKSPDFRYLMQHFSLFTGNSLITVTSLKMLFNSIIHAALGRSLSRLRRSIWPNETGLNHLYHRH